MILNRVGSPRHEQVLRQACEAVGVPVLGALPRDDGLAVPSRHLGLVTAAEHGEAAGAAVAQMTALVGRHIDLAAVMALGASRVGGPAWSAEDAVGQPLPGTPVVAVAALTLLDITAWIALMTACASATIAVCAGSCTCTCAAK